MLLSLSLPILCLGVFVFTANGVVQSFYLSAFYNLSNCVSVCVRGVRGAFIYKVCMVGMFLYHLYDSNMYENRSMCVCMYSLSLSE